MTEQNVDTNELMQPVQSTQPTQSNSKKSKVSTGKKDTAPTGMKQISSFFIKK